MIQSNFDEIVNRENTACYKYDFRKQLFGNEDVLPMWVADMDFKTPWFIIDAIKQRLNHEILGYSFHPDSFYDSIIQWNELRNQWTLKKEWIKFSPGIVPALNMMVLALTNPEDKVMVQTPVYFPFFTAITSHKRKLVTNPLKLFNGRYEMDFDHLSAQIDENVKLFILCNPHNPTGNVWKKNELEKLAEICLHKNIPIISDEIHSDLIFSGHKHIPLASISADIAKNTITCMAPSKSFNLAGLSTSFVVSSNKKLLNKFNRIVENMHIGMGNIFGTVALEAAYNHGAEWVDQLMEYLQANVDYLNSFITTKTPKIKMIIPEGTYLVWLDCRELGMSDKELKDFMINDAGLGLSDGPVFGNDGSGFQRINIGCPKKMISKAMEKLYYAYNKKFS